MLDILLEKRLHAPFGDGVTKDTRVVNDDFLNAVYLDLGQSNVEILPERSKLSNEIIATPQTTRVDVVSDKDARDSLGSHGHNLSIRLGHKIDEGTKGNVLPLKVAKSMPSVVSGVPVNDSDVSSNAIVLTRKGPECGGVYTRLDYVAPTTFLGPSDTIFGDAVRLWHACGGCGQPPFQRRCRGDKLGRVVAIETFDLVSITSEMLHCGDCMVGSFGGFGVSC